MRANKVSKCIYGLYSSLSIPDNWNGKTFVYVHGGPGSHCGDFEIGLSTFPDLMSHGFAWLVYDQRGCGRSTASSLDILSHRTNIDDLKLVIADSPAAYTHPEMKLFLYGHSYGARLVYDTLYTNKNLNTPAVISGRSIHPLDAMNTSVLIDLMILRNCSVPLERRH